MTRAATLLLVLVAAIAPARGQERDAESRARAHYEVGLGMYHLGDYRNAVREFSAGYELSPRPQFLINLGQAYRRLGERDKAAEMFRRYLAQTPAGDGHRREVQQLLDEVEALPPATAPAATAPRSSTQPSTAQPSTTTLSTAQPSTAAQAAALAASPAPATSPPHKSAMRRYWWTIPVAAVVVGAAVGLGIYFGTPPAQLSCGSASIGCVDVTK